MKLLNYIDFAVFNTHKKEKYVVAVFVAILIILHFPMQYLFDTGNILFLETIHELLDLDGEDAFGAWISQAMLLISGVSLILYKKLNFKARLSLGGLLILLSIDEIISLHERFIDYFKSAGIEGSGFFNFTWLYVGVPLAMLIVSLFIYIYYKYRKMLPNGLLIGLIIFFTGAVVFEGLGGVIKLSELNYSVFMVGAEETIELVGILLIFLTVWGIEVAKTKEIK